MAEARSTAIAEEREVVDAALHAACSRYVDALPGPVPDVIRYSLLGDGKRFRPRLLLAAYQAAGGAGDASELAAAVEVVHAYSLVHDDLPCMDDDDVRRGRPTAHRAYGVQAATAAGLAMVPLAVRCAANGAAALGLDPAECASIVGELMRAAGGGGMIGGQLMDLEGEGRPLSLEELERLHRAKTGALISASVRIGGLAARADEAHLDALDRFGRAIGLAFQIADDVLDETATSAEMGKTTGRDRVLLKSTYPAVLGLEVSRRRAAALIADGCGALSGAGLLTPTLDRLARSIVERTA